MEIGGEDLVLDGSSDEDEWTIVQYEFRRRWPEAIFEFVGPGEWFVWPDRARFRREQDWGDDEVPSGYVHVVQTDEHLTLVVDEGETEARRVGVEVFEALRAFRENPEG